MMNSGVRSPEIGMMDGDSAQNDELRGQIGMMGCGGWNDDGLVAFRRLLLRGRIALTSLSLVTVTSDHGDSFPAGHGDK